MVYKSFSLSHCQKFLAGLDARQRFGAWRSADFGAQNCQYTTKVDAS